MDDPAEALAVARETVERQAAEIAQLRRLLAGARLADELGEALTVAAAAGVIASSTTYLDLLQSIVQTAAHVIAADAASLFLLDRETEELVFEVTLGEKAEEVRRFRVPLGHGIAGLVAVSGQPMAVSEAHADARQAADIAQSVDYIPESILCVPLFFQDEVIGVLELLNKRGAPSFSPEDMHTLGLFANGAAVAIQQARTQGNLVALIGEALATVGGMSETRREAIMRRATGFATAIEEDPSYTRALDLAGLVREIAAAGENESRLCRRILESVAEYHRSRPALSDEFELTL